MGEECKPAAFADQPFVDLGIAAIADRWVDEVGE